MYTTDHKGGQGITRTSRYVHYWSQRGTGDYQDLQVCTLSTGHKGGQGITGTSRYVHCLLVTKGDRGLPGPPGMYTVYWSQRGTGDYQDLQVCTLLITKGDRGLPGPPGMYTVYWSQRGTGDYRDLQVCTLLVTKGDRGLPGPPGMYTVYWSQRGTGDYRNIQVCTILVTKGDRGLPGHPGMYTTGHKGRQGITRTSRYVHYWSQRGTGDYQDIQVCTLLVIKGDRGLPGPPGMYTVYWSQRGTGDYRNIQVCTILVTKGDRGLPGPPGMYTTGHKGGQGITGTSRYVHYWSQRGTGDYRDLQVCTLLVTKGDRGLPGPPGMYTTGHKGGQEITGTSRYVHYWS